jgi:hypothetical protein
MNSNFMTEKGLLVHNGFISGSFLIFSVWMITSGSLIGNGSWFWHLCYIYSGSGWGFGGFGKF